MSNSSDRSSLVLIKEAELLSGSADYVRSFYEQKANSNNRISSVDLDVIAELNLLAKGNEFIVITLAQYCLYEETLAKVFSIATEQNNLPLKLACLRNKSVGRREWSFTKLPLALFNGDAEAFRNWFGAISPIEIDELFSNETIDDGFLTNLLDIDNDLWRSLAEEDQRLLIRSLSRNKRISESYEGPMDGYAEYLHEKLFTTIWDLAKKLPVTSAWATALSSLLESTKDVRFEFNSIEVAQRWYGQDRDVDAEKPKKFLDYFENVRYAIYKDSIKDLYGKDKSNKTHFDHNDIAYRAGASEVLRMLTVDDIKYAYQKDGVIAVDYLIKNLSIWRDPALRDALRDISWDADREFNDYHMDCANTYKWMEEDVSKRYPNWFVEKESNDSLYEDDKALTLDDARSLLREANIELVGAFHQVINSDIRSNKLSKATFYGIIAIVMILIFK